MTQLNPTMKYLGSLFNRVSPAELYKYRIDNEITKIKYIVKVRREEIRAGDAAHDTQRSLLTIIPDKCYQA